MILWYPMLVLKMMFVGKSARLSFSERSLNEPGMLGMLLAAATLLLTGLRWWWWSARRFCWRSYKIPPYVARRLGGRSGGVPIHVLSLRPQPDGGDGPDGGERDVRHAAVPPADGCASSTARSCQPGYWVLLVTSVTSFASFHHLLPEPAGGPVLLGQHHELGHRTAAISIFTVPATIWQQHGLGGARHHCRVLVGWRSTSSTAPARWSPPTRSTYQLHGTRGQSGPLHDGHPRHVHDVDGRSLSPLSGAHGPQARSGARQPVYQDNDRRQFLVRRQLCWRAAAGMPRCFADWHLEGWMLYGNLILFFGPILGARLSYIWPIWMKSRGDLRAMGELARVRRFGELEASAAMDAFCAIL